jgi:hypothetical protein
LSSPIATTHNSLHLSALPFLSSLLLLVFKTLNLFFSHWAPRIHHHP